MKIKICIVTGTRAEYGLFLPLLKELKIHPEFEIQIVATGMHLSPEFGLTYKNIEADGYIINEKVEMLLSSDSDAGIAKSTGLGIISLTDSLSRLQPDWVVVLGDRFETFAAATASYLLKIPLIHLHGGELTEGATDEAMRHAITKMSYLHFASTEVYRKRIIQLGEAPERVFNVGAIGLDNIKNLPLLSKTELENQLGISLNKPLFLITYHPVTLEHNSSKQQFENLLEALDEFKTAYQFIFTLPNADAQGRVIIDLLNEYVRIHPENSKQFTSLGQLRYLSLLQFTSIVIGNSSSGIIEVPSFKIPIVNIGDRQRGRIKAESVIDCGTSVDAISKAISKAINATTNNLFKTIESPYGDGSTAQKIVRILKLQPQAILKKTFYDI
jgi:UDP-hydrolysing UDP-N-acetyl-D-glucosamine 2-epimerase